MNKVLLEWGRGEGEHVPHLNVLIFSYNIAKFERPARCCRISSKVLSFISLRITVLMICCLLGLLVEYTHSVLMAVMPPIKLAAHLLPGSSCSCAFCPSPPPPPLCPILPFLPSHLQKFTLKQHVFHYLSKI